MSKQTDLLFCCSVNLCNIKSCSENLFHLMTDEQERVQKKVFTNWINHYVPNCIEEDIIEELRDGTRLLQLLEKLTGQPLVSIS